MSKLILDESRYVYGTKVIRSDGKSSYCKNKKARFKWNLKKGAWHEDKYWDNLPYCGNGLHFWKDGAGDCRVGVIAHDSIWLLVRALKSQTIDLGGKYKAKKLQILDWGNRTYINNKMFYLKPKAGVNFVSLNRYCPQVDNEIEVGDNCVLDYPNFYYAAGRLSIKCKSDCIIRVSRRVNIDADDYCLISTGDDCVVKAKFCNKIITGPSSVVNTGSGCTVVIDNKLIQS